MSADRKAPVWPKIVVGLIAVALLLVLLVFMARLFLGALNLLHTDGGTTVHDPQFAEPAETFAPPPELTEPTARVDWDDDPSSRWVEEVQTPVDMTADQLASEDDPDSSQD